MIVLPTHTEGADTPVPYDNGEWYADRWGFWMVRGSVVPDFKTKVPPQPWTFKQDAIKALQGKTIKVEYVSAYVVDHYGYAVYHDAQGSLVCIPIRHYMIIGQPMEAFFMRAGVFPNILHDGLASDGLPNTWMVGALNVREPIMKHIASLIPRVGVDTDWRSSFKPIQHEVTNGVPTVGQLAQTPWGQANRDKIKEMAALEAEVLKIQEESKNLLGADEDD